MKTILIALTAIIGLSACASTAEAHPARGGQWVLNPAKCPDLVEDVRDRRESRRDERYDRGPRDVIEDRIDRRESRRDEAVTRCPARAWEWRGSKYNRAYHSARPRGVAIYYVPKQRHYYYRGSKRGKVVIRF